MSFPGKVAVLYGGTSAEREVSLVTGRSVADALSSRGVAVHLVDTAGDWWREVRELAPAAAFLALHGRGGEDGSIQGALTLLGIPFTGSGVLASALAMDKIQSKRIFLACGLPTPPFLALSPGGRSEDGGRRPPFPLPWVVKPSREGSTVGVTVVRDESGYGAALKEAAARDPWVLVERFVPGDDYTVGVLNGESLAVVQIVTETGFYDYRTKYVTGASRYVTPAPMGEKATGMIRTLATEACRALRCTGAARVDFRGDGESFSILEVNTIPGMTPTSLLPKSAAGAGIAFSDLVMRMLSSAGEGGR